MLRGEGGDWPPNVTEALRRDARRGRHNFMIAIGAWLTVALPLPVSAHEADKYLKLCGDLDSRTACEHDTQQFRSIYVNAFKRDYQAQRNLAYLLSKGDAAVAVDPVASCAWRLVIIVSGSPKVDDSDFSNVRYACGRIDQTDVARAKIEADTISKRIATGAKVDASVEKLKPGLDSTAQPLR